MHIWIVNHYAIAATQSGGTRHFSIARELVNRGHDVTILASAFHHVQRGGGGDATDSDDARNDAPRVEIIDGVRFVQVPTPAYVGNGFGRLRNMLAFARAIARRQVGAAIGRPDVVIGSSPHLFAALAARRVARRYRVPFVLEIRDLWPDSLVKVAGVSPRHPLVLVLRVIERSLYRSADAVISLLPGAARHIESNGGAANRVVWIPNGVDFNLAGAAVPAASARCDSFCVMYAGAIGQANAMDSLIDTAALLLRDEPRVRFRFIGTGPERARLEARVSAEGLSNVRFEDPVPKHQVFDLLREADALLVTTRNINLYEHGLSLNKLFDYLAVGRPIVFGADCPGNPVLEGEAGLVVPPEDARAMADAIRALVRMTPDERQAFGVRGRRYAEAHHDIRRLAVRFEQVLDGALAAC